MLVELVQLRPEFETLGLILDYELPGPQGLMPKDSRQPLQLLSISFRIRRQVSEAHVFMLQRRDVQLALRSLRQVAKDTFLGLNPLREGGENFSACLRRSSRCGCTTRSCSAGVRGTAGSWGGCTK